jgi:hypothetical protein
LNKSKLYIAHIDRHPVPFKKRIFAIPVLLNLAFLALLTWRLYAILPFYASILLTVTGYPSDTTVDTSSHSKTQLVGITLKRAGTFLFDFLLFKFVGSWVYTFFLESPYKGGNPVRWRVKSGFRESEIYVRVSRSFATANFLAPATTQGLENPFLKVRVMPAVDRFYLKQKTGYLTMGADWDLDFGAMVKAQDLVDKGTVERGLFERTVWVYFGDGIGWGVWECWRDDEGGATSADVDGNDDEETILMKKLAEQAEKEEERFRE